MILRDYQTHAIETAFSALYDVNSTLISAAVGAGKTLIQAGFIKRVISDHPQARFLATVHTRELVSQNMQAMLRIWPQAPIGVNSAALGRRDYRQQILFASIQSIAKAAHRIGHIDCMIIDECHLLPESDASMYRSFISNLREINPAMKILGMSGTPFRLDSGWLHKGKSAMFESLCFEIGIPELIDRGFLVPPINRASSNVFDISGVKVRGGDYVAKDLQASVNVASKTAAVVNELVEIGRRTDRRSWIVFCAGVEHAYAVRDEIRKHGVSCETVEGNLDDGERARILRSFKEGRVQCLTNVNICSIGFDHPPVDLLALMRPTKSASLYIQQVGRGLRICEGKKNALVLDFAGVVKSLGPVDMPMVSAKFGSGDKIEIQAPPLKACPHCQTYLPTSTRECSYCGHEFPRESIEDKLETKPDDSPILSREIVDRWLPVTRLDAFEHRKDGAPPSMRVEYLCGLTTYREWITIEHPGFAGAKAQKWWRSIVGTPAPATAKDAVARMIEARVLAITIQRDGKFWRVASRRVRRPDGRLVEIDDKLNARPVSLQIVREAAE